MTTTVAIAIGCASVLKQKSDNVISFNCTKFPNKFIGKELLFIASMLKVNVLKEQVYGVISYRLETFPEKLQIHAPHFIEVDDEIKWKLEILSHLGYNYTCMILDGDEVYCMDSKLNEAKSEYLTYKTLMKEGETPKIPTICKYDHFKIVMPQWIVQTSRGRVHVVFHSLLAANSLIQDDEIFISNKDVGYYIYQMTPNIYEELDLYHTI